MQKLETISSIHGSYKLYIHFGSEKKKKKKERPLKELYKCHSSNPFFLARRSHSLTTNTHHLNTHTHRQQRTGDDRNTALRTNTHNSTQDKKKTVQHHCLQHSSQGLCTHPRLNQKKKKLFYQSSQGKSSAVICDRESHQKACLAVRHRHTLPRGAGATAQFFLFYAELAGSRSGAGGLQIRIRLKQTKHLSRT